MKFKPGRTVVTRAIDDWMNEDPLNRAFVAASMSRHLDGDWGEVSDSDKEQNNEGINGEGMLLSVYTLDRKKIWIITEWDRNVTTVLFPEEY